MRLAIAELLGMRKRLATYVVLIVLLVLMGLVYLAVGATAASERELTAEFFRFPQAYTTIGSFVFGLGSLVAVAYAAAIGGGDWSWGVPRLIISRGESRARYVLAKAAALAGVLGIGMLVAFGAGILMNFLAAAMAGIQTGSPLDDDGAFELLTSLALGYPVLVERALIGFAVAITLRSQLAGVVVGILLFLGENILVTLMVLVTLASRGFGAVLGGERIGPEWFQYLPFTIGDSVLVPDPAELSGGGGGSGSGFEDLFLQPVPLEIALLGVVAYAALAIGLAVIVVERTEITA